MLKNSIEFYLCRNHIRKDVWRSVGTLSLERYRIMDINPTD